jgi:predicted phage tail protein
MGRAIFVTAANMSWVDLYPLAQYANQLVTTPEGTQEPRFACNTVIGDQSDAFNVLQDLASVFRGMLFWQANTIQATADHGNLDGSDVAASSPLYQQQRCRRRV